jgi:hypothetical protein
MNFRIFLSEIGVQINLFSARTIQEISMFASRTVQFLLIHSSPEFKKLDTIQSCTVIETGNVFIRYIFIHIKVSRLQQSNPTAPSTEHLRSRRLEQMAGSSSLSIHKQTHFLSSPVFRATLA